VGATSATGASVVALRAQAKQRGLVGYSRLSKEQLLARLK
jgi:hypothetical protein